MILLISSAITVSYLLWLAGHETDVQDMAKVGKESILAGIFAAIIPIIMITATTYFIFGQYYSFASSIGQGVIFSATSVSIPIAMLIKYGKMHLKSAKATMGAAIIDDILAIILFSIFIIFLQSGSFGKSLCTREYGQCSNIGTALLKMLLAFIIMFIVGKFFISPTTKWLSQKKLSHLIPPFAIIMMFSYFSLAELIGGLAGITGSYFAGLFHRTGDAKHKAVRALSPFISTICLPLFLGSIGMQIDIGILKPSHWRTVIVLLIMAILSKFLGCFLTTFISNLVTKNEDKKWSFWESYIFSSSMSARGEVGLVIATILLNSTNLMSQTQYIITVAVIIFTTLVSPILLSIGFNKLEKKFEEKIFEIKIGPFQNISTRYLFDILSANLEIHEQTKAIISLPEGGKILTLKKVKIILNPEKGIIFKGNETKIRNILSRIKESLQQDVEKIPVPLLDE